jgi:PadR family transcriptional regulator PadR
MVTGDGGDSNGRRTQLLRGILDVCLLAVIAERSRYGYELVEALAAAGLPLVSEGSIYPLLARLERLGLVDSYRQPSAAGPPRKYYRLTAAGEQRLAAGRRTWHDFAGAVSQVLSLSPVGRPGTDTPSTATTPEECTWT